MAMALPDAVVINRKSEDITVHRIDPNRSWFYQSPLVQRVMGGAKAATILDLDGDGKVELIHLTGVSGDAYIRRLDATGGWSIAGRYPMGARPQTLRAIDLNSDGLLDLLSTSLGDTATGGGLGYRLQGRDGTFGLLTGLPTLPGLGGSMFAEIAQDFDGDGMQDLVVGYYDCRVAFFQGTASGLKHIRTEFFVYESRALSAVDADQDGDVDLVGVGAYGDIAVVENDGKWFKGGSYRKILSSTKPVPGASRFTVQDLNNDGDPDLIIYTPDSVSVWHGTTGLAFAHAASTPLPPTLDSARTDFDGDGQQDIVALCPANTTVSFFRNPGQDWWTTSGYVPYSVPAVSELAVGDLDGDGRPDLVGVGDYLWVALSGTPAPASIPIGFTQPPIDIPAVVINEVLAVTTDFVAQGAAVPVDCVEIFNGTGNAVNLSGWKLRCEKEGAVSPAPEFTFPATTLQPGEVAVIYCDDQKRPWSAPFKLPREGCTLRLLQPGNVQSDVLKFPSQQADISYSRLPDGGSGFVFNPFPSIGSTNYDNGNTQPKMEIKPLDVALLKLGTWRFRAKAWSASGMFTLMIHWQEITTTRTPRSGTIALFDDGMHDDGASLDGSFAGDWDNPLPLGSAVEFFLTGSDLRGEKTTEPESPGFTPAGRLIGNYTIAVAAAPSGWEISEVVPVNHTGLRNGAGMTADWTELRYTGTNPQEVKDLFLSDSLFGYNTANLYDMARLGTVVQPRSSRIVFLDGTTVNAPFKISGDGDSIYLIRRLPSGATELLDGVKVPTLPADTAYARMGVGGPFFPATPTPAAPNAPAGGVLFGIAGDQGSWDALFAFAGAGGVETSHDLVNWSTVVPWRPDIGAEKVYRTPMIRPQMYFRVR